MNWSISDEESERAVIGAVLVHPATFTDCAGEINATDFYQPRHREIWTAMTALDGKKLPIDAVSVWAQLQQLGAAERFASVGGSDFLRDLMANLVTVDNQAYHARYF